MTDRVYTRLTIPLIAVSVLLLGLGVGAAWYVHNLQHQSSVMVDNHMISVRAGYELELSVRDMRRHFFRFLLYGKKSDFDELPVLQKRVVHWLEQTESVADTDEEVVLLVKVRKGCETFFAKYPPYEGKLVGPTDFDQATQSIESSLVQEIYEPVDKFQKINEAILAEGTQANRKLAGRLITGLVGVGVCGAVGGILVGVLIASSIRRSIHRTEVKLRSTAEQLNRVAGDSATFPVPQPHTDQLDAAVQSVSASAAAVIERLDRSQRDALRAEQLAYVGQMAAGIAHEVRNPLMAIKILVQKAGERSGNRPFLPRDLEVLEDEIDRVEQIVSDFLDFARPPRIEKHVLEARPLLERAIDRLTARAELQHVEMQCNAPFEPLLVDVDSGQFQQVIYNLLLNALDSQPTGGQIVVDLFADVASNQAVIQVKDEGPGLPDHLGDRVFEPFISSKESGLGLGLSICKRIVEAHRGSIRAENRQQGGAVFSVRLPLVEAPVLIAHA